MSCTATRSSVGSRSFLTGTDEHGINIQRAAEKAGKSPQEQVDFIAGELKRMFADFGLGPESGGYDIFMRTTGALHYEGVRHLWEQIVEENAEGQRQHLQGPL